MPTIFERIIAREIPADFVYEDEHVVAFRDIAPQAPTHVLIIPRIPLPNLEAATPDQLELLGRLFWVARRLAVELGVSEGGYRLVLNDGEDGGQTVPHIHVHLLGGRSLRWPPG